jgi:CHAT domain-containing protein
LVENDLNALYAKDMGDILMLKDRQLIFAAACQTGLSAADRLNESELMGMLRPLTANRNRNVILSLWNVDDTATKEFVSEFYRNLAKTKRIDRAFHHAQSSVRERFPHPHYWAAFYLSQSN